MARDTILTQPAKKNGYTYEEGLKNAVELLVEEYHVDRKSLRKPKTIAQNLLFAGTAIWGDRPFIHPRPSAVKKRP